MASLERAPRFLNPWSTLPGCSCHPVVMVRLATLLDTLLQKRQLKLKPHYSWLAVPSIQDLPQG